MVKGNKKRIYGLIGKNIEHSFSPRFFDRYFKKHYIIDASYNLFPCEAIDDAIALLHSRKFDGLNVTMPFKQIIIEHLDVLDSVALNIGAVNTILPKGDLLIGYNTDYYGCLLSLQFLIPTDFNSRALILGSGGSSQTVQYVLDQMSISYKVVSRNPTFDAISYVEANMELESYHLIINTTPLGMHPNLDQSPNIDFEKICSKHCIFDFIYNPKMTLLLKRCKERGARILNGQKMLESQALNAWKIWNQK